MKIVFFGTSDIAAFALEALIERHRVLAVVTALDKKKGRGQKIAASAVKLCAQDKGITVLQPRDLKASEFLRALKDLSAELFVVCSYGRILPKEVLRIPLKYTINLHTSVLPKYRGAAPINWAIINGECQSGVSIFRMNEKMDAGELILLKSCPIDDDETSEALSKKLAALGAQALLEALSLIEKDKAVFSAQDEDKVTYAPKLEKQDGKIDWKNEALNIHNRIRGLQPWPGAFTSFQGKLLKIWDSEVLSGDSDQRPGRIVASGGSTRGIVVQTGKGRLRLRVVQIAGGRRMSAKEFVAGHEVSIGSKLG